MSDVDSSVRSEVAKMLRHLAGVIERGEELPKDGPLWTADGDDFGVWDGFRDIAPAIRSFEEFHAHHYHTSRLSLLVPVLIKEEREW